jgi:RNA polymerase sigma factor (sigma-70 family)
LVAVPSIGRASQVTPRRGAPEADATRDLYERYARQIHAYCLHHLGSREEAEDAVQSTFLNAFRGLKRGVDPEFESAWLYKIAENVCLTRLRSSSRRRRIESPGDLDAMQDLLPSSEADNDELIRLPEALEEMPEQQRRALLLREWQGLSYREIADELSLSQSAVETLLFRARRSLASALTDEQGLKKGGLQKLRAGGDAGSLVALLKTIIFSGGAKVAATAAAVAATSVVAAIPAVHDSTDGAFAPVHVKHATRRAVIRQVRHLQLVHAAPAALAAARPHAASGKVVAAVSRAAHVPAASAGRVVVVPVRDVPAPPAPAPVVTVAPVADPTVALPADPVLAAPTPAAPVPVAATAAPPVTTPPSPEAGNGSAPLPTAPPGQPTKDPGSGPQADSPVAVAAPLPGKSDVKAARQAAKADDRAARLSANDHGKKSEAPVPAAAPATTPTPAVAPPATGVSGTPPAVAPAAEPAQVDVQPGSLVAPAAAPTPAPPTAVAPAAGSQQGAHGERNGHRK